MRLLSALFGGAPEIGAEYVDRNEGPFAKNIITPLRIADGYVEYSVRYHTNGSGIKSSSDISQFNWMYMRKPKS